MREADVKESRPRLAAIFIGIALAILFVALAVAVIFVAREQKWHSEKLIIVELSLLVGLLVLLIFTKYFEGILLWIASLRATRWLIEYDRKNGSRKPDSPPETLSLLVNAMKERHGAWRWRYRDRWVLVAGDEPLVKRLAPGLTDTGYAITSNTVLLHAKQTRDRMETDWLDQIRRLRRRRPVDAIVAVVRHRGSGKDGMENASFDTDDVSHRLARHARALRWAAPAYLLNVTDFGSERDDAPTGPDEPVGFTWSDRRAPSDEIDLSLRDLARNLASAGVARLAKDFRDRYPAELSRHVAGLNGALSALITQAGQSRYRRNAIHGLLFAPLYRKRELDPPTRPAGKDDGNDEPGDHSEETIRRLPPHRSIWQMVADHSRKIPGRRVGFSWSSATAWAGLALVVLWTIGLMVSGLANRDAIASAAQTLATLRSPPDRTRAAQALDALDAQLDTLEIRQRDGAPWHTRFGLNHDKALHAALWPAYEHASADLLVAPIRARLEDRLRQLASLSDAEIASGGADQVKAAYATLKTYLMLAKPAHADAAFLTPQLLGTLSPARPADSPLTEGGWLDLRRRLVTFFAAHLGHRVGDARLPPAIVADASLVASTRQTVIGVIGLQNSTDTVYQRILDDARPKYPAVSLAALLGDSGSRGLFATTATVSGVFTREAWDERIAKAIDDAARAHTVSADWVLSDTAAADTPTSTLRAELRQRYFDDYARAWEQFLNTVRWQAAPNLSGTVDQLALLSDPQRSPLAALMRVVVWQGAAGAATQSLSDSLIGKARALTGTDEQNPSKVAANVAEDPLASAFGPLLRFAGGDVAGAGRSGGQIATGDLSLPRYIERVSAMRLKLQQIVLAPDPNATSRTAAQAVLQGRTSEIAESRDYGSRVAASFGQRWAGFGDLFEAPLDQTWQRVLQPAASSLNETWRHAIVADWNRTFGGRYPFADSDNDASLPEMARFMRPDTGVIAQFIGSQLAGVIERQGDHWAPVQDTSRGNLSLDPAFLAGINRLMRVSTVLFPAGDAQIRFDLRGVPTSGVSDVRLVFGDREFRYFNQQEAWVPFVWPDPSLDARSHIEWQTAEGGLRTALDAPGRFGPVRLFEKATVAQQDNARYLLTWAPDQGSAFALNVQLRSEAGAGPMEVLQLRHYRLPERIFMVNASRVQAGTMPSGPPPLPPAAREAGRRAAVALPAGTVPEAP